MAQFSCIVRDAANSAVVQSFLLVENAERACELAQRELLTRQTPVVEIYEQRRLIRVITH